ncbi:hypothetical protein C0Q70_05443 [Pomacea canaliculata]|uniref:Uncharacterized protein n=1 Tax=Pomacea canaliculata TaxID=400727 RepID=A0A2T7PL83_POMCA|nr:hypothetical protein C0Q70_05443 [Pomacea canaliculata]
MAGLPSVVQRSDTTGERDRVNRPSCSTVKFPPEVSTTVPPTSHQKKAESVLELLGLFCTSGTTEIGEKYTEDEFTPVHTWLYSAQSTKDAHLLHVTHYGCDVQALQLGVHGVQAAHQVLQEAVKGLRQADELAAIHHEGRHLGAPVFNHLAHVVLLVAGHRRRGTVGPRGFDPQALADEVQGVRVAWMTVSGTQHGLAVRMCGCNGGSVSRVSSQCGWSVCQET